MLGARHNDQVATSVILLVSVLVVNDLARQQHSAKHLFGYKSVLVATANFAIPIGGAAVTLRIAVVQAAATRLLLVTQHTCLMPGLKSTRHESTAAAFAQIDARGQFTDAIAATLARLTRLGRGLSAGTFHEHISFSCATTHALKTSKSSHSKPGQPTAIMAFCSSYCASVDITDMSYVAM